MADFNPIPDETTNAALKPTAEALGSAAGTIFTAGFNLILTPLRKYNIRKEQELTDYANRIKNHITNIPVEDRDNSKVDLVLKAVDDSKFRLDDPTMREAFARLIANALNAKHNQNFYPAYSNILSNMSPEEALILKKIYKNTGSRVPTITPVSKDMNNLTSHKLSSRAYLFDSEFEISDQVNIKIDLLIHSGLIQVKEDAWLSEAHYAKEYKKFKDVAKLSSLVELIKPKEKLDFVQGYVSFTSFGSSFTKFIV